MSRAAQWMRDLWQNDNIDDDVLLNLFRDHERCPRGVRDIIDTNREIGSTVAVILSLLLNRYPDLSQRNL